MNICISISNFKANTETLIRL